MNAMNVGEKEILDDHKGLTQIMKRMIMTMSWIMMVEVVVFEKLYICLISLQLEIVSGHPFINVQEAIEK